MHANRQNTGYSVKEKFKAWGRYLLLAGALCSSPPAMTSCNNEKPEEKSPFDKTGIYLEPYRGEAIEDENGNHFMESRFIVLFETAKTREEVENLTAGRVTGHIPQLNAFEVEVTESVDASISHMSAINGVRVAARNYLYPPTWDNDSYKTSGTEPEGLMPGQEYLEKGLWWSTNIKLSEGLDILSSVQPMLSQTTVAVIDLGIDTTHQNSEKENPEFAYVDSKYHFDFGDIDYDVKHTINRHGNAVIQFIAARNNGKNANGVAALKDGFQILPLKVSNNDPVRNASNDALWFFVGDDFRLVAALYYINELSDKLNIRVVNISLGLYSPIGVNTPLYVNLTQPAVDALINKKNYRRCGCRQQFRARFLQLLSFCA